MSDVWTPPPLLPLLKALITEGLVSKEDSKRAELHAQLQNVHLEEAIIELDLLTERALLRFEANHYGTHFVSTKKLARATIHPSLLKLVPRKLAASLCIFPVKYKADEQALSIVMPDPTAPDTRNQVKFATRIPNIHGLVARPAAIQAAIKKHFDGDDAAFRDIYESKITVDFSWPHYKKRYLA